MLYNLKAEMARNNIRSKDIAKVIKRTEKNASEKIHGKKSFSYPEVLKIKNELFPQFEIEYLFSGEPIVNQDNASDKEGK